jgi:hypothetical protein
MTSILRRTAWGVALLTARVATAEMTPVPQTTAEAPDIIVQEEPEAPPTPTGKLGPYEFTPNQVASLMQSGCRFDGLDEATATKLAQAGFGRGDFVRGYEIFHQQDPSDRRNVERWVRFGYLRLDPSKYDREDLQSPVTELYNSEIGGRGLTITGWVLTGVGVALLSLGVWGVTSCTNTEDNPSCAGAQLASGILGIMPGVILSLVGLPMGIVGLSKMSRWAPESLLDNGNAADLQPYQLTSSADRMPRPMLLPPPVPSQQGGTRLASLSFDLLRLSF